MGLAGILTCILSSAGVDAHAGEGSEAIHSQADESLASPGSTESHLSAEVQAQLSQTALEFKFNPPPASRSEYKLDLEIPKDFVSIPIIPLPETALDQAEEPSENADVAASEIAPTSSSLKPLTKAGASAPKAVELYNVPIVMDSKVEGHIRFFNSTIRDKFEMWLTRLSHYHPVVERIFTEFGLPTDLVYLSLVESGFNPHAYSRARATGPWQFMKGTGKLYGLRVDKYVDERRDPIKSTVAAARYLRDLYDLFGSWPLAMAAYNAGEGKVMRALRKSRSDSFSAIAQTRLIRRETKEYVPRFMAATVIAKNPDRYGFQIGDVDTHEFDEVIVGRSLHLRAIASASGVSYDTLRKLNPELRLEATPPDDTHYHLKVPVGAKEKIEKALERVPTWKAPRKPSRSRSTLKAKSGRSSSSQKWYRVRSGDTLIAIAKRFNLSVRSLKERNNIFSARQLRAGDLLSIR